jgi:hypothetical protein
MYFLLKFLTIFKIYDFENKLKMPIKENLEPGVVAHACNSSYVGGGNQEDCDLRTALAKSYQDLISTNKANNMWL